MDHVFIGVVTHKDNHIAVAIDAQGALLGSTTISTTRKGYQDLEIWAAQFGQVKAFGIEGTGSFSAGLSRDLLAKGHEVLDVMRPNRQLRYLHGKSDRHSGWQRGQQAALLFPGIGDAGPGHRTGQCAKPVF